MAKGKAQKGIWGWFDRIQGDKVILIILIILVMISLAAIFGSTSQLANMQHVTRLTIFKSQVGIVILGMLLVFACYKIDKIGWFMFLSQFGFAVSATMLLMLLLHIGAVRINGEYRALQIGKFQLQVYEFVKIGMILYLSWATNAYSTDSFTIVNWLSRRFKSLDFLAKPFCKRLIYIYIPILFVTLSVGVGSGSSALFILALMIVTVLIGGLPFKDLLLPVAAALLLIAASYGMHKASDGRIMERWGTWEKRIERFFNPQDPSEIKSGTPEWREYVDKNSQQTGALVAVKEGGIFGKGPGRSTQKYVVPLLFSDFMFSYIVEECGLWGTAALLILYLSLLARGSIIVKSCDNLYAKTAVAGLTLAITGQAMMHIFINADGPLTGQTLPMISHGNSSFLAFSIAFGVLLSISKMAKKKVEMKAEMAGPIIDHSDDEIRSTLDDLDRLESMDSLEDSIE
ncbi:MAG: FtsW/RodA/SpoVE family cell cycle protein [Clostridium sp.]|nr:FtsW/RodA/SpoVE family cell cycle protein [Bacteroides sp.]MCM1199509.1 FtsW/RodA/SpoVE family cell cycle protein [Clostridium sp.]